jgi:hypothetical protein
MSAHRLGKVFNTRIPGMGPNVRLQGLGLPKPIFERSEEPLTGHLSVWSQFPV